MVLSINSKDVLSDILDILYQLKSETGSTIKIKFSYRKLFIVCLNLNEKFNLSIDDLAKLKKLSVKIDSNMTDI